MQDKEVYSDGKKEKRECSGQMSSLLNLRASICLLSSVEFSSQFPETLIRDTNRQQCSTLFMPYFDSGESTSWTDFKTVLLALWGCFCCCDHQLRGDRGTITVTQLYGSLCLFIHERNQRVRERAGKQQGLIKYNGSVSHMTKSINYTSCLDVCCIYMATSWLTAARHLQERHFKTAHNKKKTTGTLCILIIS